MADLKLGVVIQVVRDQLTEWANRAKTSLTQAGKSGKQAGDEIAAGLGNAQKQTSSFDKSIKGINNTLSELKGAALAFFGIQGAATAVSSVAKLADEWNNLNARIKLATGGGEAFEKAQAGVIDIATSTGTALGATADLFTKIANSTKDLGTSQKDQLAITQAVSQSFQVSGTSAAAASGAILQFGQALASGVLRGDEFNSVMEAAPRLAQALADGLDVPRGALRKMAEEGELSAERVTAALLSQKDVISAEFATLPKTVGRSLENLNTQWTIFVGNIDKSTGASAAAAGALDAVANNLDEVAVAAKLAGEVALVAMAVKASTAVRVLITDMIAAKAAAAGIGDGLSASATRGAAALGRLRGLMVGALGLLKSIGVPVVLTFVYESVTGAISKIRELRREQELVGESWGNNAEQMRLFYERLDQINRQLGTNFQSMEEWKRAVADGTVVVDEAANKWVLAAERNAQLNTEVGRSAQRFNETSAAVENLSKAFDKAAENGKGVEDAILAIAASAANGQSGLAGAAGALENIGKSSKEAAKSLREDLAGALQKMTAQEFESFAAAAQRAFDRAGKASTQVAGIMTDVVGEAARRLGIDAEKIGGGFTKTAQESVSALRVIADTGKATGAQLLEAVGNALKNAKTVEDVQAIQAELVKMGEAGMLSGAQIAQGQALATTSLAGIDGTLQSTIAKINQQATDAAKYTAELVKQREQLQGQAIDIDQVGASASSAARELSGAITASGDSWFLGIINDYRDALGQLTEEAAAAFRSNIGPALKEPFDIANASAAELQREIAGVGREMSRVANDQGRYNDQLSQWALDQEAAFLQVKEQTLSQALAVRNLTDQIERGSMSQRELAYWTQNAANQFDLLGDQQLDPLISAIERAQDEFRQLADEIRGETEDLQDELDRLRGNEAAIADRRYQERLAELQEKLRQAQASGNRDLVAQAQEAIRLLQQVDAERKKQAAAEAQKGATADTNNQTPQQTAQTQQQARQATQNAGAGINGSQLQSTGNVVTIRLQGTNGQTAQVLAPIDQAGALVEILRRAGLNSTQGGGG